MLLFLDLPSCSFSLLHSKIQGSYFIGFTILGMKVYSVCAWKILLTQMCFLFASNASLFPQYFAVPLIEFYIYCKYPLRCSLFCSSEFNTKYYREKLLVGLVTTKDVRFCTCRIERPTVKGV